MPSYTDPTWTNGSGTAINAANLENISQALQQALQADGTGPVLASLLKIALGTGWQNNSNNGDRIGFGVYGSASAEVISQASIARISGFSGGLVEWNVYNNGTNDLFLGTGSAKQIRLDSNGIQTRTSTASGVAGGTITWGSWANVGKVSYFSGSGAGTVSHGLGTTPSWVGITENVAASSMTVGVDTIGSSTVHVNVGTVGAAWIGVAMA